MPEFRFTLLCRRVKRLVFLHLDNEPNFGGVTEVGHCKATDFLDERLTSKFKLILTLLNQVFDLVGLELHDATYA